MSEDNKEVLCITTCPGGSNVSMLAFMSAVKLEKSGYGKFVRLAGDRAPEQDQKKLQEAAEQTKQWVLIEGCHKGCGKKILDTAGINVDKHLIITDIGIERVNTTNYTNEELEKVIETVKAMID